MILLSGLKNLLFFYLLLDVRKVSCYVLLNERKGVVELTSKRLLTATELGEILGITKQAVLLAAREGRLEAPEYKLGNFNGWTHEQAEDIAKTWRSGK